MKQKPDPAGHRPALKIRKGASRTSRHRFTDQVTDSSSKRRQLLRFGMLAVGLLLVAALIVDLTLFRERSQTGEERLTADLRELVIGLVAEPYVDREARFSIVPPAGWKRLDPETSGYHAAFESPLGPQLGIISQPVEDDSFPALLNRVDTIERELGVPMNLEVTRFNGYRATRRTARLQKLRVVAIDFATDGRAYHLQFSAHPNVFENYLPVVEDLLATFKPLPPGNQPAAP